MWEVLGAKEAADVCSEVSEPGSAAKRLLDLAQSYGSRQALSVIVVRVLPPQQVCHTYSPPSSLSQEKTKTISVANSHAIHASDVADNEGTGNCRRVKFNRSVITADDPNNHCLIDNQKQCSMKHIDLKFDSYNLSQNGANINNKKSGFEEKSQQGSNVTANAGELDRSSPSGQSQSDYSEHCVDIYRHDRTITKEVIISSKHKDVLQKSVEDLYAQPHRKKREVGKKSEAESKIISYTGGRKGVTYYHYPRPDPTVTPPENHLTEHLLSIGQSEAQTGVLAPPAGFGDIGSDSEGSDSGLSGVSGQHHASPQNFANSKDEPINNPQQATEEQFRSWEYLLARNAKLLYMRELDTLNRPKSQSNPRPTASAPDLILAAAAETEPNGHFQRNNVRKSRLGRGTFRLIQNKLNATTNKFNSLQKFKSTNPKSDSNFRRFGSLQNLKYYQENRPRPPHYPLVQPDLAAEMQERPTLDSLELETRMHHYWHTGVTNF